MKSATLDFDAVSTGRPCRFTKAPFSGSTVLSGVETLPIQRQREVRCRWSICVRSAYYRSHGPFRPGSSLADTDGVAGGLKEVMEEDGQVWMGRRDLRRRQKCRFAALLSFAPSIMRAHVAVLANPGMTYGNTDGITRGRISSDRAVRRSKGGRAAPARKMPFPPGSYDPIVRGNPTELAMLFVRRPLNRTRYYFWLGVNRQ
jgi:hypothetical protein